MGGTLENRKHDKENKVIKRGFRKSPNLVRIENKPVKHFNFKPKAQMPLQDELNIS